MSVGEGRTLPKGPSRFAHGRKIHLSSSERVGATRGSAPLPEEPSITTYRIDADDVIQDVDAEWLEFAELNDTPDLSRERVVGRSLWDFVAGAEVEHIFRMIFERCRERSSGARVPFRCDSPTRVRRMILAIEPRPHRGLEVTSVLLDAQDRDYVSLLDATAPRSEALLSICSWCKRIELPDEGWTEVEPGVRKLELFNETSVPQLSHDVCPDCEARTVVG